MVQRSHELAALLATSRAITSSIDYDVVLREVACAAAEALGCPESVIWEYVLKDRTAVCRVLYEHVPGPGLAESIIGSVYPMGDYPGGMEAVRRRVVVQQSLSDVDLGADDRAAMIKWGEKTWLSVPLVHGDEVLGMMILIESENERRFTEEEVRMASLIGEQAAAALHNARLHRREEDQHRWLAALAEATRVIASRLDRVELLQDVARLATDALLVDGALVYELDEHTGAFTPRALAGETAASAGAKTVDAGVAEALRRGELVLHLRDDDALAAGTAAQMDAAGEQTVVWVPFRINDETLGAMRLVELSKSRRFAEGELSFAHALGEHAAIALNNARLYAQIEDQATKDGLTGLANHRHFYDRLAEELERARRSGTPLAMLMLDIDDFKKLNDTYGHPAGDEVLRVMGRLMCAELRKGGDLVARYGGEEFCAILAGMSAGQRPDGAGSGGPEEGGTAIAERLRRRIAASEFPIGPGGAPVHVTVSIGVASWPDMAESVDELVARADAALYAAKRAGKDRVEVY
jgi:diguanylate cyclase (GGDEF)-like protein